MMSLSEGEVIFSTRGKWFVSFFSFDSSILIHTYICNDRNNINIWKAFKYHIVESLFPLSFVSSRGFNMGR